MSTQNNDLLFQVLINLMCNNEPVVLFGDMNINWNETSTEVGSEKLLFNLVRDSSFHQFVDTHTHCDNFLNLIISSPDTILDCKVSARFGPTCDHSSVLLTIVFSSTEIVFKNRLNFSECNFPSLIKNIAEIPWLILFDDFFDINDVSARFLAVLHPIFTSLHESKSK